MRGIVKERWSAHGFARKKYFHLYILEQAAWLIRGTLAARRHSPRTFFLAEGVWIWWWDDVIGFANDLCWFVICRTHRALCRHTSPLWLTFVFVFGRYLCLFIFSGHGHGLYLYHLILRLSLWPRPKDSVTQLIFHTKGIHFFSSQELLELHRTCQCNGQWPSFL